MSVTILVASPARPEEDSPCALQNRAPLCHAKVTKSDTAFTEPPFQEQPVAACRHSPDPTVNLQEAGARRTTKLGRLARGGFPWHRQAHLAAEGSRPGGRNSERQLSSRLFGTLC